MFTEKNKTDIEEKYQDAKLLKAVLMLLKRHIRSENCFLECTPPRISFIQPNDIVIIQTTSALILLRCKTIMLNS